MTRITHSSWLLLGVLQALRYTNVLSFSAVPRLLAATTKAPRSALFVSQEGENEAINNDPSLSRTQTRRVVLQSTLLSALLSSQIGIKMANADTESFESIAARASQLSSEIDAQGSDESVSVEPKTPSTKAKPVDTRTIYDFSIPVSGKQISIRDLVTREINGEKKTPKAILVVNIKQDDPIARKNIPELITLGARCVVWKRVVLSKK